MIGQFLWQRDERRRRYVEHVVGTDSVAKDIPIHAEDPSQDTIQIRS